EAGRPARVFDLAEVAPPPLEDAAGDAERLGVAVERRVLEIAELLGEDVERAVVANGRADLRVLASEKSLLLAEPLPGLSVGGPLVDQPVTVAQPLQHAAGERDLVRLLQGLPELVGVAEAERRAGQEAAGANGQV